VSFFSYGFDFGVNSESDFGKRVSVTMNGNLLTKMEFNSLQVNIKEFNYAKGLS